AIRTLTLAFFGSAQCSCPRIWGRNKRIGGALPAIMSLGQDSGLADRPSISAKSTHRRGETGLLFSEIDRDPLHLPVTIADRIEPAAPVLLALGHIGRIEPLRLRPSRRGLGKGPGRGLAPPFANKLPPFFVAAGHGTLSFRMPHCAPNC